MVKVTPEEVKLVAEYVHRAAGIVLDEKKAYLIEARFGTLVREFACNSYADLIQKARSDASKTIERRIVDAITTNETLFFRDTAPFELLQHKIIPDLIDKRSIKSSGLPPVPIRIWSAACSSGQEVYSITIVLKELLADFKKYNVKLLGTDISSHAIAQASRGEYNRFEIERGLAADKLQRYFIPNGATWKIKDDLRALASFRKFNLMGPFTATGKWDIVLCRNVAIYFNTEDRIELFNKIAAVMEPDGYLIIGATESLTGVCPLFEPKRHLRSIFYQLKP